jgi:tRNA(fMet)-specific endonuclease VapC
VSDLEVMLDTNIVSDLIRNPRGKVAERLSNLGLPKACVSILTAGELRYGARKRGSNRLSDDIEGALKRIVVVSLEAPADVAFANVRHHLTTNGQPIGPMDLLIAAHALALDLTLVTANIREFSRVPNLRVENWLD